MRRRRSRPVALIGALAFVLALVSRTSAVAILPVWTITPIAFTAYAGQAKTVTFTVTNLTPLALVNPTLIGCVRLNVPNSVVLSAAAIVSPPSGWTANLMGGGVAIQATSSGARLGFGAAVRFSVTMTPNSVGAFLFSASAFEQMSCSSPLGGTKNIAATILTPIVPTPTPVPTASPVPTATPASTAAPTATPNPLATPAQTPGPGATATPTPTPAPGGIGPGAGAPSPTPSASPTVTTPGSPDPSSGVPAPSGSSSGLSVGSNDGHGDTTGISIDIGPGTAMDGIEWSVPVATLGTPGLALIVWVAIQTGGGIVWLPWVRRLRRAKRRPLSRSA
jgi:hypothetical protein